MTPTPKAFLQLSGGLLFLTVAACVVLVTGHISVFIRNLDERSSAVVTMSAHTFSQADRLLNNANQFVDDTYYDNYSNVQTTGVLLREMSEVVRETRESLLPEITASLKESRKLVAELRAEVGPTSVAVRKDLDKVANLVGTLEEQIKVSSPKVDETITELVRVLDDVGNLLESEHIAGTLSNVDKTTQHLSNSAESVDIALRPLREKTKLIKLILMRAAGMVKLAINPF
jgi:hypothetical protein